LIINVVFLEPWSSFLEFAGNFAAELHREAIAGHITALAQHIDSDEVLYQLNDGSGVAVVHLTWIGEPEQSSEWPDKKIFPTLEDWVQQGMMVAIAQDWRTPAKCNYATNGIFCFRSN
jgi:hypothetical protein